jgi:hypothetical protein
MENMKKTFAEEIWALAMKKQPTFIMDYRPIEAIGTGKYWSNPNQPLGIAGRIDKSKINLSTLQRLGYYASQGNTEASQKIASAKMR